MPIGVEHLTDGGSAVPRARGDGPLVKATAFVLLDGSTSSNTEAQVVAAAAGPAVAAVRRAREPGVAGPETAAHNALAHVFSFANAQRVHGQAGLVRTVGAVTLAFLFSTAHARASDTPNQAETNPPTSSQVSGGRKRLSWQIQALAEGGLSPRALAKIEELAPLAPVRWRPERASGDAPGAGAPIPARPRDSRLPAIGSTVVRVHQGVEHQVTILADGFEYQGQRHTSLSQIARLISGTPWNGYTFFGLQRRPGASQTTEAVV
jgi:hypothetical protein